MGPVLNILDRDATHAQCCGGGTTRRLSLNADRFDPGMTFYIAEAADVTACGCLVSFWAGQNSVEDYNTIVVLLLGVFASTIQSTKTYLRVFLSYNSVLKDQTERNLIQWQRYPPCTGADLGARMSSANFHVAEHLRGARKAP